MVFLVSKTYVYENRVIYILFKKRRRCVLIAFYALPLIIYFDRFLWKSTFKMYINFLLLLSKPSALTRFVGATLLKSKSIRMLIILYISFRTVRLDSKENGSFLKTEEKKK